MYSQSSNDNRIGKEHFCVKASSMRYTRKITEYVKLLLSEVEIIIIIKKHIPMEASQWSLQDVKDIRQWCFMTENNQAHKLTDKVEESEYLEKNYEQADTHEQVSY